MHLRRARLTWLDLCLLWQRSFALSAACIKTRCAVQRKRPAIIGSRAFAPLGVGIGKLVDQPRGAGTGGTEMAVSLVQVSVKRTAPSSRYSFTRHVQTGAGAVAS